MTGDHPLFDALERDRLVRAARDIEHDIRQWFEPHASQAPAGKPVNVGTITTTEDHMSLAADLHNAASRLEAIGEDGAAILEAVSGNPATKELLGVLHALTGLNVDPGLISLLGVGLKELCARAQGQQQAAA